MTGFIALIATTILLTGLFAIVVASVDIEEVKGDWSKRRCEIPIIFTGGLYKREGDPRSSLEFSQDNFQFCIRTVVDNVLKVAFAPLYLLAIQQKDTQNSMTGPLNSVRAMITKGKQTFSSILDKQYRQYTAIYVEMTKTFYRINSAMNRIGALVTTMVYIGLTGGFLAQNTLRLIVNVVLIVVGIISAMILLIWFSIIPFLVVITAVVTAITVGDIATEGWLLGSDTDTGAFCVDPEALIKMADGNYIPLKNIVVGDRLFEGKVTGVLRVDSSKETIVSIDGVSMSTSHRVLHNSKWILAKDHPDAKPSTMLKELICLNTTTHSVPVKGDTNILYVGDWEEISNYFHTMKWIDWVNSKLNKEIIKNCRYPTTVPLFSPSVKVATPEGWVESKNIKLGQMILTDKGYTKVIGLYKGQILTDEPKNPEWVSDGLWMKSHSVWLTRDAGVKEKNDGNVLEGLCFITEEGTFYIQSNTHVYLVRDFTEVGSEAISESYSWLDEAINKKI